MARTAIPIADKELVVQRIAEGASTRQAILGTSIKSNNTAARLRHTESHEIARMRGEYLEALEFYSRVPILKRKACILADMLWAEKYVKVGDQFEKIPDRETQLKAIKYIDNISGITGDRSVQVIVQQQVNSQSR